MTHLEDKVVEKELQTLISNVDAELLEAVVLKMLKAKNVQQAQRDHLWYNGQGG